MKNPEQIKQRIEEIKGEKKGLSKVARGRRNAMIGELLWVLDEEN